MQLGEAQKNIATASHHHDDGVLKMALFGLCCCMPLAHTGTYTTHLSSFHETYYYVLGAVFRAGIVAPTANKIAQAAQR